MSNVVLSYDKIVTTMQKMLSGVETSPALLTILVPSPTTKHNLGVWPEMSLLGKDLLSNDAYAWHDNLYVFFMMLKLVLSD